MPCKPCFEQARHIYLPLKISIFGSHSQTYTGSSSSPEERTLLQVLRLHELRQQGRALVHDNKKNTLSVPLDYSHLFFVCNNESGRLKRAAFSHRVPGSQLKSSEQLQQIRTSQLIFRPKSDHHVCPTNIATGRKNDHPTSVATKRKNDGVCTKPILVGFMLFLFFSLCVRITFL